MFRSLLISIFVLEGCGVYDVLDVTARRLLKTHYDARLQQLYERSKDNVGKWPTDNECDGALWAGVAKAAGGDWIEMDKSLLENGRPLRKPLVDCKVPEESATTTSNDMITGIILGLYVADDVDSLSRLYKYGEDHNWIMGTPNTYVSRVWLRPNGVTLMARALHKLTKGRIDYAVRNAPVLHGPVLEDYEGHLMLVSRYLEKRLGGPQYMMEMSEQLVVLRTPKDALAQAVAGNYGTAAVLLLDDYRSPSYVRGDDIYHLVHWLFAAKIILDGTR